MRQSSGVEHIHGPQEHVATVCIEANDDIEQRRRDIVSAVHDTERGKGVIILTDMFGGTPSNLAISIMDKAHIEVIAGVNLPMLIKLASVRNTESLEQAVVSAQEAAKKYINVASTLLNVSQAK